MKCRTNKSEMHLLHKHTHTHTPLPSTKQYGYGYLISTSYMRRGRQWKITRKIMIDTEIEEYTYRRPDTTTFGERGERETNRTVYNIVWQFTRNPWRPPCHHLKHTINVLLYQFFGKLLQFVIAPLLSSKTNNHITGIPNLWPLIPFWPAFHLYSRTLSSLLPHRCSANEYSAHILTIIVVRPAQNKNLISLS